jgi:hypothetical protein
VSRIGSSGQLNKMCKSISSILENKIVQTACNASTVLCGLQGTVASSRKIYMLFNLITAELLRANIVVIDSAIREDRSHPSNEARRPGDVVNRRWESTQMLLENLAADLLPLSIPPLSRLLHSRHAGDQLEVRILLFECLQLLKKWRILRPAVRIEEKDMMRQFVLGRIQYDAPERRNADSAAQHHRCSGTVIMKPQIAKGTVDFDLGPL